MKERSNPPLTLEQREKIVDAYIAHEGMPITILSKHIGVDIRQFRAAMKTKWFSRSLKLKSGGAWLRHIGF